MALKSKAYRHFHLAYPLATLTLAALAVLAPLPARADFFDGARRTFQTDIPHFFQSDVPHFFQDDIPCAFGGQPTSHTRTSCKSSAHPAGNAAGGAPAAAPAAARPDKANQYWNAPPGSAR